MLNGRRWLLWGAAASGLLVAFIVLESESPLPTRNSIVEREVPVASVSERTTTVDASGIPASFGSRPSPTAVDESLANDEPFRVDDSGELVVDEQTRLNIERLVAHTETHNLSTETREQTENLPPTAARRVQDLVDRFVHYQQAQRQTQPPDAAPSTEDDAVRQLEELHALREAHFGPEVARQFYGKEEVIAREMIEVMRLENDQSLTPQEKRERARVLREQLPTVSVIEKNNRESDATQKQ